MATPPHAARTAGEGRSALLSIVMRQMGVLTALILLVIVSSFLNDRFLTIPNVLNVLRQVSIVGILAVGMTFVILTKGIDLSMGSILGVSVVLFAGLLETQSMAVAIPLGILAAMALGLVNGLGVAYAGIPPFIMTLEMLSFARGLAFIYTGGTPIPILNESFYDLGNSYTFGVPNPTLILIVTLLVSGIVLARTPFGRAVYAIGSNEDAARLSGVPVQRYKTVVYVISGGVAGIAGLVYASQLSVGTPIAGQTYELDAIAAVVVGGTSPFGGKGSVAGTFIGTLIIGVLANILKLRGRPVRAAARQGRADRGRRVHHGAVDARMSGTETLKRPTAAAVRQALDRCEAIRPAVDAHVTPERLLRYLAPLSDTPAPSGVAAMMRAPVLMDLLVADGVLGGGRVDLDPDFRGTGAAVMRTGGVGAPRSGTSPTSTRSAI